MVDASVVAVRDATQTLTRCSICDDVQAVALRICCDHTRDGFDQPRKLARTSSREQESVSGCTMGDLVWRTGGDDFSFRQKGGTRTPFSLGEIMGADNYARSLSGQASDALPDFVP
jgi:hypothetical protein